MITRIEAYRYRCFERINVSVGNYVVLVGRNGAGKSTLIDIPVAIGEILQRQDIHSAFFGPTPSHPRPRADGALDLWSVLRLAQEDPEGYEEWNAHMATVLPRFVRVEARQRDDDQFAYLRAHYENGLEIPGHALSDGTLFLFAYTLLPFLDNVPEFLAIEEPEKSIHPKAIEAVLETLQVMDNSQVLVTTHSPITVAVTPVDKLLCLQQTRSEGVVVTRGREHPQLENWEGIPGLGVLHSAGIL